MQKITVLILLTVITSSTGIAALEIKDFPLWGSEWVISDGQNKGVYRSSLKLAPKDLMKVSFSGDKKSIVISWANCKQTEWNSTSQLLQHIENELRHNKISAELTVKERSIVFESHLEDKKCYPVDIQYQNYNDTLWTAHKQALYLFDRYNYSSVTIRAGEKETVYNSWDGGPGLLRRELEDGSAYTTDKPVAFATRRENAEDIRIFDYLIKYGDEQVYIENVETSTDEINGENVKYKSNRQPLPHVLGENTIANVEDNKDWRQDGSVNEFIRNLDIKTENLGYWQVHLHPVVIYYPRNPYTGEPVKDERLKMDWDTALKKKRESLANTENAELQFYRNPWLDEKNSCIISFQFTGTGKSMTQDEFVWLDAKKAGVNMDYTHIPKRMFNTYGAGGGTQSSVYEAIYKQYAETNEDKELARTIDGRCAGWRNIDSKIGNTVFPTYDEATGKYTRDRNINDQIFSYGDCPCFYEDKYAGLTKAQLKQYAFMPLPTCKMKNVEDARRFYNKILRDMEGEKRVAMVIWEKMQKLNGLYQKKEDAVLAAANKDAEKMNCLTGMGYDLHVQDYLYRAQNAEEAVCPDSWTDTPVIQEIIR